ncbi:MAG: hypothetical protein L0Z53_06705 [Acidobacteriales bacterium]|nr:hypothetical protein [Terriglobales bacterium]
MDSVDSMTSGPDGPPDAEVVVVGRDFGWQEQRDGKPFVGASGKLLNEVLEDARMPRSTVLVTNVVNERPAGDDWEQHEQVTINAGHKELRTLLGRYPRKAILTLGAQAFLAVARDEPPGKHDSTNEKILSKFGGSITELRGYSVESEFGTVVPSVHPAFVVRQWLPWRACLTYDAQKVARLAKQSTRPTRTSRVVHSPLEARMLASTKLAEAERLAVDIETDAQGRVACVAFAPSAGEGYALDVHAHRAAVKEVLALPCPKVFMNGMFDTTMLMREGMPTHNWTDDVMVMWHACEPLIAGKAEGGPTQKSLRFLASILTDEPHWKNYDFQSYEDKLILCATDARITFEVFERLQERMKA